MKCVKLSTGSVERVTDMDAHMLVRDCGASYISKTVYKKLKAENLKKKV